MPVTEAKFWIVGVGSSAGGLEALSSFVRELPVDSNAVFVIAQHLAPHSKSMMVELLSRQTKLPVVPVQKNFELKPGTICVIPPNHDAVFQGNTLKLSVAGEETRPKPSVDTLFKSMAQVYKDRAVGIILSGTGSDGAEGIRAIKENGGIILSQDKDTAKYDGMPRAAQDLSLMDEVLSAEELGRQLFSIIASHQRIPFSTEGMEGSEDLQKILQYLKVKGNVDFSQYKLPTVARRIEKRLAFLDINNLKDYLARLEKDPTEMGSLAQEMLISVTSFFRDGDAFQALERQIAQILETKGPGQEFRVWVAGCATGEEAYSIAILALEFLRKADRTCVIRIFATDLDSEAVIQARNGNYTFQEMGGMSEELLDRYFDHRERGYEARKILKDCVVFARQNLIQNPPFVKLDLVTCRNVLIYFDSSLQQRVFEIFQYALKENGILFLGKSENAPNGLFETLDRKAKVFRKLVNKAGLLPHLTRTQYALRPEPHQQLQAKRPGQLSDLAMMVPEQLIREYKICAVVVDEEGVIYHMTGDVSSFIKVSTGTPDFRLPNLISKTAGVELAVMIRKCWKTGEPQKSRYYTDSIGHKADFLFIVRPLENPAAGKKPLYVVSFERKKKKHATRVTTTHHTTDEADRMISELKQELDLTKEHLQTLVEELEVSNEELQSLNEELSSTNEELQASNEELETTNEEFQSTNEELVTVNEELNTKSAELRLSNLSLENIQNSIGAPLLVVDSNKRIRSYNQDANKIFILHDSDLGRALDDVSCHCEIEDFDEKINQTIQTGRVSEGFCTVGKSVFQIRIYPNRDERDGISGAVIVFFDNTEMMQTKDSLQASEQNIRAIIDGSPALITLKDMMGRYLVINRAFQERYDLMESDILGKTDRDLMPPAEATRIRDMDLEVFLKGRTLENQETVIQNGKPYTYYSARFPLKNTNESGPNVMGTVSVDITPQILAQQNLQDSEARYRAIIEDQAVLVCRTLPDGTLTFTNTAFHNFLGGTVEANRKRKLISFVQDEDREIVKREIDSLTPSHSVTQYETRVVLFSGAIPRWIRWIHRAIYTEAGELFEHQVVGFDVTEIHHQTSYLLQKENLFTHVLEHTSDYLTVYKVEENDFILESYNPSAAKSRSPVHPHLVGKRLSELTDQSKKEFVLGKYLECARLATVITFEEEVEAPRGSIYLLTTLVPILDKEYRTERVAALSRDITHLKRIELALREETLRSDAANQAKSDFLTAMSHELRTPLGVISGMTQLLARDELSAPQKKYVTTIQHSSKVLLSLIEDVLDISKIESGNLKLENRPFGLGELISDVRQTFEVQAKQKQLDFKFEIEGDQNVNLNGDQTRIRQVLINLLGNALKFTEAGSIETRIEVSEGTSKNYCSVFVEVRDTGIGIAPENFYRIFNRFSQADGGISRRFGGTGLGLSICKQLVELMGGEIGFDSKKGKGSLFWFKLELPRAAFLEKPEAPDTIDYSQFKNLSILAVDDSPDSLDLLELILKERVKTVHATDNAMEAIELLKKNHIDLIVMDIQMPGIDGMEAAKRIRKLKSEKSSIPIIALTANAMTGDRERFLAAGMDDYVSKPIDFPVLFKTLQHWNEQKTSPFGKHPA